MRTAIGATAVNIAKPTNLGMPMIHAFLDNIRYITIELNGLTVYDPRDDVRCDMDKWRETRTRFPARWPVVRLTRPTSQARPGSRCTHPSPLPAAGTRGRIRRWRPAPSAAGRATAGRRSAVSGQRPPEEPITQRRFERDLLVV